MSRYFFDLVREGRAEYDYRGRDLPTSESAYQLAELIAVDLAIDEQESWCGWMVKVRNVEGREIGCVCVQPGYLAAA
jgi:hypothetical protein